MGNKHFWVTVILCQSGQGSTAVNKQTPTPPFFLMSFSERLDNTNSSSLVLSFSLSLRANPLNAEWGREGAGKRDVEEREQLVLRADTGHVAKDSAAAYGTVKQPLCLFASLHQLSLPGSSSLCRYRDWACYPAMASQQDSGFFEISIKSLLKSWGSSEYELSTHTHSILHPREMPLHLCADTSVGQICYDLLNLCFALVFRLLVLVSRSKPHPFHTNFIRRLKWFSLLWDVYILLLFLRLLASALRMFLVNWWC